MESINSPFPQHADHDAFKSDVYSLGLTLLLMAQLKTNELMIKLDRLSQGATEAVADLPYSDQFKIVIHNMLQEDESNRPDFTQLNQVLQQGIPRPSEATTQASLYHTSIQDPYALIESLNVDPQDPLKLRALFERTGSVHAKIEITLRCSICLQEFVLDVTCGCPNDVRIIFCSEECFSRSVAQPLLEVPSPVIASPLHELQESMKQSFHDLRKENLCIACQHRVVEVRELLLCKKCNEGQKREMERINCDECVQCLRKWPKQSMLSKLFQRKKVKSFQLPCKHTVCSAKCLADAAKHRQECPKCRHPIPNRLILSFKP